MTFYAKAPAVVGSLFHESPRVVSSLIPRERIVINTLYTGGRINTGREVESPRNDVTAYARSSN